MPVDWDMSSLASGERVSDLDSIERDMRSEFNGGLKRAPKTPRCDEDSMKLSATTVVHADEGSAYIRWPRCFTW